MNNNEPKVSPTAQHLFAVFSPMSKSFHSIYDITADFFLAIANSILQGSRKKKLEFQLVFLDINSLSLLLHGAIGCSLSYKNQHYSTCTTP